MASQHYQPLSHALQHPLAQSPSVYSSYDQSQQIAPVQHAHQQLNNQRQEEEEDDEDDMADDDPPRSPIQNKSGGVMNGTSSDPKSAQPDGEVKSKRGPGRPKGSRSTKKPNSKAAGNMHNFSQYPPPPAIPQEAGLHQQHQEYYKFQWRALNLCAEFYSAAEELIKGTAPLVIAQCYQMGPGAKFDPLAMISEAKRICDSLLANPIQLINSPPPALYTSFGAQPMYGAPGYPTQMPAQAFPAATFTTNPYAPPNASTSENNPPASVLPNQPQPFVMPLGPPPMAAPPTYTVYPPRYPTTSYYQYPTSTAGYYAATPAQNPSQPASTPTNATTTTTTPPTNPANPPPPATTTNTATTTPTMANTSVPTNPNTGTPTQAPANPANPWPTGYNQGQWADDEVARLKHLTEQNRDQKGEIDWDRVIQAWGNTRTRHQILLKATSMGLKESTTRVNKRRREADDTNGIKSSADTMSVANLTTGPSESPSQSNTSSPPVATSPAMAAIKPPTTLPPSGVAQRPPSTHAQHSQPSAQTQTPHIQWALPTSTPTPPQPDQRSNPYFRAGRPSYPSTTTKGGVQHQFMYQPAGANGSGGV